MEHRVQKIFADSLKVEDGAVYYDEAGVSWFLTPCGAADSVGASVKVSYSLERRSP